jgi:Ca2+-binding EF-hand superfamily protein
MKHLDVDCDG